MNIINPMRADAAARAALIGQLRTAGVHMVRCGITNDAAGIAFAQALYAAGIKIDLIVMPEYPNSNAGICCAIGNSSTANLTIAGRQHGYVSVGYSVYRRLDNAWRETCEPDHGRHRISVVQ